MGSCPDTDIDPYNLYLKRYEGGYAITLIPPRVTSL